MNKAESYSHPDFPVVDAHVHLYPDAIAVKVTPTLANRFGNAPAFDGTVAGCVEKAAKSSIKVSLNLPVATKPDSVSRTNDFWSAYATCLAVPDSETSVVRSLAALHPGVADKPSELERVAGLGFTGVKFHPEYQLFGFNDRSMDDTWAAMSSLGLVAYLHAGGERVFQPPYHSSPAEVAKLHSRFPDLKIVAAHLGGFGMWDESEEALVGSGVFLDLSHTFFWMPTEQILRMIRNHGANRILFGTDAPWQDPCEVLEAFLALPLSEAERRAICCGNASQLLRLGL